MACLELGLGLGEQVNRKRVERLMRQAGIEGIYRRRTRKNREGTVQVGSRGMAA